MPGIAAASEAPAPVVVQGAWPGPPADCTCRRHCNALLDTCNLLHRRAGPGLQLSYHGRPPETCSGRIHYTLRRRRTASCRGAIARGRSCRGDAAGIERARLGLACAGVGGSWAFLRLRRAARSGRPQRWRTNAAPQAPLRRASAGCVARKNRASVERHTSFKIPASDGRGRVASRDHYAVVIRSPPSVEQGDGFHQTVDARPIPDNQHLTTRAPGRNQQAPARHPRSPTGGSWRFPERFRYARKRFQTNVVPSGLSLSR